MSKQPVKDPRALEAAIRTSAQDVLSYLRRRVDLEDAADLLGETMVVAWRRVDDLPADPIRARMWLFGIARGTLQNHARGERRRWALANRLRGQLLVAPAPTGSDDGLAVRDAISHLDPELAELVRLIHWEGFSIAEASELMGVPGSTGRTRYQRAREQLREALTHAESPART